MVVYIIKLKKIGERMSENKVRILVDNFYKDFAGLPNHRAIVRNNTPEDAFTLAILKIMYGETLDCKISPENVDKISKIIVAPPDSGIDLFIETEDGDEYYYDIIQSKYTELTEEEIRVCFLEMHDAIRRYLKNPNSVQSNLRDIISETNFNSSFKNNCTYYVYHTGILNYGKNFKANEKIVTINEMEVVLESLGREDHILKVPYAEFTSDMFNNYILYENSSDNAMLCNIRGYDLAVLCNKYVSSSMGRNILFGQNLRDSLDQKKSKTYEAMMKTIKNEPERFWNYNNGITILCEELDAHRNNTCMFYCIALYFTLKDNYGTIGEKNTFDYFSFYRDNRNSPYKDEIIDYFANKFLQATVKIMSKLLAASGSGSATNWLKKAQSQTDFFDTLSEEMAGDLTYQEMYTDFVKRFTI